MAFTFGFYNALNHDRRYNAIQVSSIFDGIIKDGIFMSIGGHMNVKATGNGFNIVVESGRAWFNHTWSLLDADYPMVVPPSDVLEDRIDVVVLEVNENVDVRQNFIKIISGTPAEHPTKPALTNNLDIHQYALAYITVPANSVTLTQSNVENAIGLSSTPFVTGILETINIDDLVAQWKSQWNDWTEEVDLNWNNWFDTVDNAWTTWFTQQQSKWEDILADRAEEWEDIKDTVDSEWASQQGSINSDYTNWKASALAAYNQWLDQIKGTLDDDAATQLAKEVVELKNRDDVISTYQHVKSGIEHMFIGSGSNGKVKMTADISSGDKVVISSAPKEKITVEGATSQPGSGDPSPDNIRMIDGVGMYDQCVVLDGSSDERWESFQSLSDVFFCDLVPKYGLSEGNHSGIKVNRLKYKRSLSALSEDEFCFQSSSITTPALRFIIRVNGAGTNVQTVRNALGKAPLTVWYRSVDYYKSKGPFYYVHEVSDGTESPYKAIGVELNAPLFDGDSLKVGGKSGFDKMVVLDGSDDEGWTESGTHEGFYFAASATKNAASPIADDVGGPDEEYGAAASHTFNYLPLTYWGQLQGGHNFSVNGTQFGCNYPEAGTLVEFKSYLQQHPLTVFYRSTEYTKDKDIPVAIEKHTGNYLIFDGTETVTAITSGSNTPYLQIAGVADNHNASHRLVSSVAPFSYSYGGAGAFSDYGNIVFGKAWCQSNGFANTETMVEDFKSFLTAQYSAGTPVQVVYELASAAAYAHPIQTESLPAYYGTEDFVTALAGEPVTDKWLTFTNDGTQLNFKGGGGVGVSKLAATTAVPADVVQGKTFYSKDKTLKTGTLADKPALNDAVSVGNDGNYLYARIPVGAYRAKQSTGYPEIRFPNSDAIENIPGGDNGAWSGTYSGSNVTVPQGYHNGNGSVGVAGGNRGNWNGTYSGSDVAIPKGYHAGGGKVSVAGGNKGAWGSTIDPGGSVTIPKGYHNGSGKVAANPGSFSGSKSDNDSTGSVGQFFSEGDRYSTKATGTTTVTLSGRRITVHTRVDMYGTYQAVWNESFTDKHLSAADYDIILDF